MIKTRDMTTGSETKHLIRFALPLLAGNLLQQTYNAADTMIVGKFLGDDALAAVGATGSITYFFYTLCIGLSIGSGILAAQLFGAGKTEKLRRSIVSSGAVTAIFGIAVSVISVLAARPVLQFLNVPGDLLGRSVTYMRIACSGTICVAAYNWINAIMRALGNTTVPLIFLGISTVLNIGLDLLFVMCFGFGVGGAAAATILAQGLSAAGCIIYCFGSNKSIRPRGEEFRPDKALMKKCMAMGIPIAIQNGLVSISMIALQRVTNGFGNTVMASYTVSMRIEQFVQQPFMSMNAAISSFTGQNIGAGKQDRAVKGLRSGVMLSSVFAVMMFVVFLLFGRNIAGFFVSGKKVIAIAGRSLIITGAFYIPLGMIHTVRGFLNGAGDTAYAIVNGLAEVISRIGFSLILTNIAAIGFWGIWITTSITWVVTAAVSIHRYFKGKWKLKAI